MNAQTAAWLAWIMCALSIVLTMLSLWLLILNLSYPNVPSIFTGRKTPSWRWAIRR